MKKLYLLRHAKSDWGNPSLEDHDRPLNKRGRRSSLALGRWMRANAPLPRLILCSTAKRASDTLDNVLDAFEGEADMMPEIIHDKSLYLCGVRRLLERLQNIPDDVDSAMLVAHNPDMHMLAMDLAGSGDSGVLSQLALKYPTGALTILALDGESWSGLIHASCELEDFIRPRDLEA